MIEIRQDGIAVSSWLRTAQMHSLHRGGYTSSRKRLNSNLLNLLPSGNCRLTKHYHALIYMNVIGIFTISGYFYLSFFLFFFWFSTFTHHSYVVCILANNRLIWFDEPRYKYRRWIATDTFLIKKHNNTLPIRESNPGPQVQQKRLRPLDQGGSRLILQRLKLIK